MEPRINLTSEHMDIDLENIANNNYLRSSSYESSKHSETETWSSLPDSAPDSTSTQDLEQAMDQSLTHLLDSDIIQMNSSSTSTTEKRKRGRKPIRPNDPVKKKTEEKDKYWLRAFRAYMKEIYSHVKQNFTEFEKDFWRSHLRTDGKPDKGNRFLSYGRKYKDHLFSHDTFITYFKNWFQDHGEEELSKKHKPESPLWFVFYDYADKELFHYTPRKPIVKKDKFNYSSTNSSDLVLVCEEDRYIFDVLNVL